MDFFLLFFRTFFFRNIELICKFLKNFKYIKNLINDNDFFFFFFKSFDRKVKLENFDDLRFNNFFKKYNFFLKYYIKINIYKSSSELIILKRVIFYFLPKFFRNFLFNFFFFFKKYIMRKKNFKKNLFKYKNIFDKFFYLEFMFDQLSCHFKEEFFDKKNFKHRNDIYRDFLFLFMYIFNFLFKKIFLNNFKIHIKCKKKFFFDFFLIHLGYYAENWVDYYFFQKMHMKVINRNKINTFFKNLKEYKDDEYFFTFEFYDYYLLNKNYLWFPITISIILFTTSYSLSEYINVDYNY